MQAVFITGSNRGIGLEFAKQYAKAGWQVYASCRNPDAASNLQALSKTYPNVTILPLDVTDETAIIKLAASLKDKPIDILINNAGIYHEAQESLAHVSPNTLIQSFETNAMGPLMIARALMDNIKLGNGKIIVNMTSVLGSISETNSTGSYAYRTSKAALNMMMKTLSYDYLPHKIRVLVLHPGWVKTDMGGLEAPLEPATSVEGMRKVLEKHIAKPLKPQDPMFMNYKGDVLPW